MKSQKTKAQSQVKAKDESEEYRAMERLMISLTYLTGSIVFALVLIVGGLTFATISSILGGPVWIGLLSSAIGLSIFVAIYVWAQIKESR